ncbi:hypothetical protein [Croceimicrobium hydrocarbonivorans]|uniref:Uncharacterized protein n=1 Tax=Croceimicrobium hydrocarbonivorans TaxID=2761580 RepID=A0A7H0VB81_9FLAO|nr:hypothetical protein [Croceimicrobium hydrocarbonivorans]QNR22936.1 hypothetical protein H4K34_11160 [Croceimicrobium hydrocarbonivorans]QNR22979.1 hypothetical protein H4K34_11375 [Croceimicrobium hydrocarbonivorans]
MSKNTIIEKAHLEVRKGMALRYSAGMEIPDIYSWAASETDQSIKYLKIRHRLGEIRELLREMKAKELAEFSKMPASI